MFCFSSVQRFHITPCCFLSSPTTSECVSRNQKSRSGSSAASAVLGGKGGGGGDRGCGRGGGGGEVKCGMHNVRGAGLTTICLTTAGSEAGIMPIQGFLFSSSTVEPTAATVASMLILWSSSLLLLLLAPSCRSARGVDTTRKKPELLTFGGSVELGANQ